MRNLFVALALLFADPAAAFCGFYVAKADSELYNQASRVVLARQGEQTVVTMANDYKGAPEEFAMIVPVPNVIEAGAVRVVDRGLIDRVDDFTAPRLVEYFDENPCDPSPILDLMTRAPRAPQEKGTKKFVEESEDLGVTIEAEYKVEEYDVLVLSAKQSEGLQKWLDQEGYRVPASARDTLGSYIKQGLRFFVAKVDVSRMERDGEFAELRPLQVEYSSPRFGLPIRLGTVNATGPQDLLLYVLTSRGRVETTNYRTVRIPTNRDLPEIAQYEFPDFYRAMFAETVEKADGAAVVTEYSWPLSIMCDPCSADLLTVNELNLLGAKWVRGGGKLPEAAHVTRLHARYDAESFPDDLKLQETGDREPFQGRYVIRHPYKGPADCPQGRTYHEQVRERQQTEVENLAELTGWTEDDIWQRMDWVPPERRPRKGGGGPLPWQLMDQPLP